MILVTVSLQGGQVYRHQMDLPNDPKRAIVVVNALGALLGSAMDGRLPVLPLTNPFAVYRAAHISGITIDVADNPSAEGTLRAAMGFQVSDKARG